MPTFCEACIHKFFNESKAVRCPKCKELTNLSSDGIYKSLSQDIYMSGLVLLHGKNALDREIDNFLTCIKKKACPPDKIKKIRCFECHFVRANSKCIQCNVAMCDQCFEKVHSSSIALKMHQMTSVDDNKPDHLTKVSTCALHNNRELEYYCEDDNTTICSRCVIMGDHKGHTIIAVEEKNQTILNEIEAGLCTANVAASKLRRSLKILTASVAEEREQISTVVKEIRSHFQNLHAKLQTREDQLIEDALVLIKQDESPHGQMKKQMNQNLKDLEETLKAAQEILNNSGETRSDTQEILDAVLKAKDIPCCLLKKDSLEYNGSIRFQQYPDCIDGYIKDIGRIECDSQCMFHVRSLREAPEEITEEDLESVSLSFGGSNSCSDTTEVCDNEVETSKQKSILLRRPHLLHKQIVGRVERVQVTHLKNPSSFMVQRCSDCHRITSLMKLINGWCRYNGDNPDSFCTALKIDDFVLAKYTLDNKWYRARVKKVFSVPAVGEDCKKQVDVLYVDYGNSETLPLNRLRMPLKKFLKDPEYAIECCLPDITSPNEAGVWSSETIQVFASIVATKTLMMTVIKEVNNVCHVELSSPPVCQIRDDIPMSVKDALVFLGLAKYLTNASSPLCGGPQMIPARCYPPSEPRYKNEELEVIATYIENPGLFFVQKLGEEYKYLAGSMKKMQQVYNADTKDLWCIYCPIKNFVCACRCPDDGYWYRAQITDLPGEQMVNVCYVDYGNADKVSYLNLRKLLDEFLVLPVQAKQCSLAFVEPVDSSVGWTDQANEWLINNLQLKEFVIKITDVTDSHIEVILQDLNSERVLNQVLIDLGFAKKKGGAPEYIPKVRDRKEKKSFVKTSSFNNDACQQLKDAMQGIEAMHKKGSTDKIPRSEGMETFVEVTMSTFHNPGNFYLHVVVDQDKLNELMTGLQSAFYESEPEPCLTLNAGTDCVVYYDADDDYSNIEKYNSKVNEDFNWFRARVLDVLHNSLLKVFFIDYGYERIVPVSNVRTLKVCFVSDASFALKCHLSGCIPAGGKTEWTQTACEYTLEELKGKRYFIVKQGDVKSSSMPVDLLIERIIPETALEPTCKEYFSLGKKLKENGLALPDRRKTEGKLNGDPEKQAKRTNDLCYKPYPLPSKDVLYIVPTYVNEECVIYAHECLQSEDCPQPLKVLNECLKVYKNEAFSENNTMNWQVGNCCLCFYEAEKIWARAKVIGIKDKLLEVCYIDFGNEELISRNKIRADIEPVVHLPPLCIRFVLYGIVPVNSGEWSKEVSELVHSAVVGKLCGIQVMKVPADGSPCEVRLICPDGKELGNALCEQQVALRRHNLQYLDEQSEKIEKALQSCNPYSTEDITSHEKCFPVVVTHVELPNVIYFQNSPRSQNDEHSQRVNQQLSELEQLAFDLNEYGPRAPLLKEPKVGQACCCQFTYDDCWYRSLIIDRDVAGEVFVLYVDYGTSEYIALKRVRELSADFLSLPAQAFRCVLNGLKPSKKEGSWTTESMQQIINSVINRGLLADIKAVGPPCKIDLYSPESVQEKGQKALAYQSVIDSGLINFELFDKNTL